MNDLDESAAGIEAARAALIAMAEGDQTAALEALNRCSHAEAVWAAAWLLSGIKELVSTTVGHDPRRLELALKAAASGADADIVVTQVGLIAHGAARDL